MSAVCILTPVVVAAWPSFSAAVVAAAASLGYAVAKEAGDQLRAPTENRSNRTVDLEIPHSEIVTNRLDRNRHVTLARDGVTVTFSRDARGRAGLCVTGTGYSDEELRALGKELSQRVVQQYVYQRIMDEARARGLVVVEDEVDENQSIRLKIRHWEN